MEITTGLKRRFCKNCNIPISIFIEPFFSDRILLFDKYFNTIEEYNKFLESIKLFNNEQDYYEHYNKTKDAAIKFIQSTKGYERFNNMDMTEISKAIAKYHIPSSDIYKPMNDGKRFISIDMKQANFHALREYSPDIFNNANTWEEFMQNFTDDQHIIGSKYIRQVILGNCNPKRHITYEKYLMSLLIPYLTEVVSLEDIVCFTNDEIIIQTDNNKRYNASKINEYILNSSLVAKIPLKVEEFELKNIGDGLGFIKLYDDEHFKLKCVDNDFLPMILRLMHCNEVRLSDLFFIHKDSLARFNSIPENIRKAFNYDGGIKQI